MMSFCRPLQGIWNRAVDTVIVRVTTWLIRKLHRGYRGPSILMGSYNTLASVLIAIRTWLTLQDIAPNFTLEPKFQLG